MIREIVLKDFQNHKKLRIKLGKVTVLVGESYAGKSAVVRALRLLATNKPRGNSYVRHGAKSTRVVLRIVGKSVRGSNKTDQIMSIVRGRGANAYYLDGKRYAPERKRSVPEPIERLINLGPVNFQQQDEPHLWLFDSPGQVAKHLNEIADLETMDRVMGHIASKVRRLTAEVRVTKDRLREAKQQVERLSWIPGVVRLFRRLERLETAIGANRSRIVSAERSVSDAVRHRRIADRLTGAIVDAKTVIQLGASAVNAAKLRTRLEELIVEVEKNRPVELPDASVVIAARTKADGFAERRRELESLIMQAEKCSANCSDLNTRLNQSQKRLFKSSNKRCPTCGQRLRSSPLVTSTCHMKPRKPERRKVKLGTR